MSDQTAFVLNDFFASISELADVCTANAWSGARKSAQLSSFSDATLPDAHADMSNHGEPVHMGKQSLGQHDATHEIRRLQSLLREEVLTSIVDFWHKEWTMN
ncbi:hypothetical protein K431DRAFT_334300 [Polychaeton citri CBS 116435]|uniref:Uncharacterized protein n=1 Tax=Polychaeton citri CBS 116435 TaxID=1314669 RepID=A0A9P4Q2U0_9PEZI|nr:hypothetical protein K431DRAFT_334300 [Polychaeton citri CBS 116435]